MPTGMMLSVTMRDQTNEVSLKKMTEWGGRQWQPLEDGVSSLCWPSGRCSRSRATRARRRPGLAQALGPDGPGAARSRGPASPCLAVRLRGSRGQLSDTPGALSRVPGRGAGPRGRRRRGVADGENLCSEIDFTRKVSNLYYLI